MSTIATAELLEDAGAAASGEEFFRSPQFLAVEGVTHSLRIEAPEGELFAPLIVRGIPGTEERDAISPYGYPGVAAPEGMRVDPADVDFGPTGLVSVFIRHALGEPPLTGTSERSVVQVADPELPRKSRASDRQQIRRNERAGYESIVVPGPGVDPERTAAFNAAYEQTMHRASATDRYFFGEAYFARLLTSPRAWLALALAPDGDLAAGSLATLSDGTLHYYLSGTADDHLRASPMKNVVTALVDLSAELGAPLNLGGGIDPGDRLEEFKRGFANREHPWHTSEIITNQALYNRLASDRETEFFPAYRATEGSPESAR